MEIEEVLNTVSNLCIGDIYDQFRIYDRSYIALKEIAKSPNDYTHRVRSFFVAQTKIAIGSTIFMIG